MERIQLSRKSNAVPYYETYESNSQSSELPGENIRLFEETEYPFDVIKIDENVTFEAIISPLRQIKGFLQNYDEYVKYLNNATIRELQEISQKTYMALFYKKEIELLDSKEELIVLLNKIKKLLSEFEESKWSVDDQLFEKIEIDKNTIEKLKELLLFQQRERNQLDDADKILVQMTKARRNFITQYNNAVDAGKFIKNKCPLCGTTIDDINMAMTETEMFIKNIHTDGVKKIEDIEKEITSIFSVKIIPNLQKLLENNKYVIQLKDTLSGCRTLSIESLETLLHKKSISGFESHDKDKFDLREFLDKFGLMQKEICEKVIPNKIDLSEKEVELYKTIHRLSIAFLLSIKNVYGTIDGLDILLIDDPLQTIDDISAISLADLLTQQGIGQIVLSTHEDAKAALLRYKFKKAGLSVLEKNMQKLYMETVMD